VRKVGCAATPTRFATNKFLVALRMLIPFLTYLSIPTALLVLLVMLLLFRPLQLLGDRLPFLQLKDCPLHFFSMLAAVPSINTIGIPSECLLLKNMFDPKVQVSTRIFSLQPFLVLHIL
jgi:hypothetical protein